MDKNLGIIIAAVILLVAAGGLYYLSRNGPQNAPVTYDEFKVIFNSTSKAAVIQVLTSLPDNNTGARSNLQNCGVDLSYALSVLGKNVTNYAFDANGQCIGGKDAKLTSIRSCTSEIENEGMYAFYIYYDGKEDKTQFYPTMAVYSGNAGFLADCALTRLV